MAMSHLSTHADGYRGVCIHPGALCKVCYSRQAPPSYLIARMSKCSSRPSCNRLADLPFRNRLFLFLFLPLLLSTLALCFLFRRLTLVLPFLFHDFFFDGWCRGQCFCYRCLCSCTRLLLLLGFGCDGFLRLLQQRIRTVF